jgi:hypothetical protein
MNKRYVYGAIGTVLALTGLACSGGGQDNDAAPANAVDAPAVASEPTPAKTKDGTIGEGTWEVGTDIKPGKYRTKGSEDDAFTFCMWSAKKGDDIIDLGSSDKASDPQVVTLKKGYVFETDGCGVWVKR